VICGGLPGFGRNFEKNVLKNANFGKNKFPKSQKIMKNTSNIKKQFKNSKNDPHIPKKSK
jgi:hypothetical protein